MEPSCRKHNPIYATSVLPLASRETPLYNHISAVRYYRSFCQPFVILIIIRATPFLNLELDDYFMSEYYSWWQERTRVRGRNSNSDSWATYVEWKPTTWPPQVSVKSSVGSRFGQWVGIADKIRPGPRTWEWKRFGCEKCAKELLASFWAQRVGDPK